MSMRRADILGLLLTILLLTTMGALTTSCLREDLSGCPHPFRLFVKAVNADGKDITESGDIKDAVLFIFNEKGQVVDILTLSAQQIKDRRGIDIRLSYPGHKSLTFVVWANADARVEKPDNASVKQMTDLYVKLISNKNVAQSPSDLFHGALVVPVEFGGVESKGDHTVVISPKVSQVVISAIHVQQWNNRKEGTYTFRLKESPDTYDKDGKLAGEKVYYVPAVKMQDGTLTAPLFTVYPTADQTPFTLEILCDGEVIYSAKVDSNGKQFVPEVGRLLNIIVDFSGSLEVLAIITPWNEVYQYVII